MTSTVPGITRDDVAAKLRVGVQAPDLSSLAAPTIPLTPVQPGQRLAPLRSLDVSKARRIEAAPALRNGGGFAAALAKAIASAKRSHPNGRTVPPLDRQVRQVRTLHGPTWRR